QCALVERGKVRSSVGIEHAGRLRMLAGGFHRYSLLRSIREQPGDAVVKAVWMAIVAVTPAGIGQPSTGGLGSHDGPCRSDAGVEQLVTQMNDRFLRPRGGRTRRLDLGYLMIGLRVVAGDVHGRNVP